MNIRFYKAAQREFYDAASHYEVELPGLGRQYRDAVKEALERIKQFPEVYPSFSQRTRRCLVSRFPYGIIYRITEAEIIIVAVAHLHRKPDYWVGRG